MASLEDTDLSTDVKPFLFVDHTRLLQTSLSKYFNKPLFSDITVIGPDGRKLLCHQVVLSAGSKRFANMLEQGNLANEELPVWGVDSDALQAIIEFFYSGQCNLTFPSAVAVMDAANRLDVPSLSSAANSFVREALSVNTASTILGHALQFKLSELAGSCLTVIRDKFSTVAGTKDFAGAGFDTLKRILTHMQDTKGASEEELFRAAWKWTLSEPSRSSVFDACLKIVPIPPTLSVKELIDSSDPQGMGGMGAVATLLQAAATQGDQRRGASSQGGEPTSRTEQAGSADPSAAKDGSQQQPAATGSQRPASADAAAGAGNAAGGSALQVDVTAAVKQEQGVSSAHNTSAAPQGTLSSFDPLSGQPTPTSKALAGPLEAGMFGGAGGAAPDMAAAAAAAAAAAGMDPAAAMAAAGQLDAQQYAAMYANGTAGAAAGGADGSASGADVPNSPGKMGSWSGGMGQMGMAQMGGMGMGGMGMGGMPGAFVPSMAMMGMGGVMGPGMMGMMPGYMSSGRNHAKGVCQVDGCNADLRGLRDYHLRYKICEYHLKVSSIIRDGVHQRFCQQCGRFHPLQDFDGAKRSCRARLLRHNARRRKRGEEEMASAGYSSQQQSAMKRGRGSFSQVGDMEDTSGAAAAAAAGGYWPMMGNMDPYMAMAMGGYNPDGSFNPAMMGQYAQFGMVSPTGAMMPNPSDLTGGAAAAAGEGEGVGQGGGSSAAPSKRGGSKSKAAGGSDGDWEEGEGEGGRDEVAWAAAGLEMLADVAQARSSAAGDRSRAGSDAGSKPGAASAEASGAVGADAAGAKQPQQQPEPDAQQGASSGSPTKQREDGQAAAAADPAPATDPCSVAPMQLADSPSPQAGAGAGLFVGRSSPNHDAPRTAPGADDAAAAAAGVAAGKRAGTPGAAGGAAGGEDQQQQQLAGAGGASSSGSPTNDLAFRADKAGAAAGTVKG